MVHTMAFSSGTVDKCDVTEEKLKRPVSCSEWPIFLSLAHRVSDTHLDTYLFMIWAQ